MKLRFRCRLALSLAIAAAVGALAFAIGPAGLLIGAIAALPWLAWRFDDSSGTCLVLAVQVTIACAVMIALIALMALVH